MITRNAGFALILAVAAAGCNRAPEEEAAAAGTAQHQQLPDSVFSPEHRPPVEVPYAATSLNDSISIEGMRVPVRLNLVQPESANPPFYTYSPPDMLYQAASSGEGDGHYFYTNFNGKKNENAYLLLFVFPAGTSEGEAIELVKAFVASRGAPAPAQYSQFSFDRDGVRFNGAIDLRRHNDRFYYIAMQYPAEYGDGFGPRAKKILEYWKWLT
jgi:hypothetical protein